MCMWRIFPPGKYERIHFVGTRFIYKAFHFAVIKVSELNSKYIMSKFENIYWIGYKGEDELVEVKINHTPVIGDVIHYLCDGTEDNYEYLEENGLIELEGRVVSKWTSLSSKRIIWTVECDS